CIGPLGPGSNAVRVLRDNYKRTLHAFRVGKEQPHLSRRVRTSHTTSSPHEPRRRRMPWQRPTAHHGRPALPAHKPEGRAFSYEERHTMADTAKPKSGSARSSGSKRRSRKDTSHDLSKENKDTLLDYYRRMLYIRRFEERTSQAYTQARIGGYCHLNLGEEATVVGLMSALRETDYLFTNYRDPGYAIETGMDPKRVMAELYGRVDGVAKGRGGSMHMYDTETRLLGGYGIVGGQLPLATGAAMAVTYKGGDEVVMCQMGDGTTNIGAWHESLNIAKLWNLPVVFVVINNFTGMGTTV